MTTKDAERRTIRRRTAAAATYALHGADGEMQIVNLNKALFYSDLFALRDHGHTITGAIYLALPMGPVVAGYKKKLIRDLETWGWATQREHESGYGKPLALIGTPPEGILEPREEELLEDVGGTLASKLATALSEFSHTNLGWKHAWDTGLGAQPKKPAQPINLVLALQQLLELDGEDDPWMDEPALDHEFDEEGAVPW